MLEEFITQGLLKRNPLSWILPTFIAFIPFLAAARMIHRTLEKRVKAESRAILGYYITCGGIGLMIEWFLIGLAPWSGGLGADPLLMLVFQAAMFSFWATVAFAPQLILDKRSIVSELRRWYKRFLTIGFVGIYFVTLASAKPNQFLSGIVSVMILFLSLNLLHFKYIRSLESLGRPPQAPEFTPSPSTTLSSMK